MKSMLFGKATKACSRCKKVLPLTGFYKGTKGMNTRSECKSCTHKSYLSRKKPTQKKEKIYIPPPKIEEKVHLLSNKEYYSWNKPYRLMLEGLVQDQIAQIKKNKKYNSSHVPQNENN